MGDVPDWYLTIKIAKYLGVAPWELENQCEMWSHWGLDAMNAEALADKKH